MNIPFSPPYIDDAVIDEVVDTLRSGWITTGPKVRALEEQIRDLTRSDGVLCVNSWTSGAMLTLQWFGLEKGDEVIIPAYTYSATALSVIRMGGTPVMVDVGDDFNITTENIRKALTPRTKAVMPVDFGGWPCDYDAIMLLVSEPAVKAMFTPVNEIQRKLGRILVLNDAAHSLGATCNGRPIGTECDITIFSLHAVKNITTAEGGAISLNLPEPFDNAQLYKEFRLASLNYQSKDAFAKAQAGGWRYDITDLGMKVNMADLNAAVGLAQIREYPALLKRRREVAERYAAAFSKVRWAIIPPLKSDQRESSYHLFALRMNDVTEQQRDRMIELITQCGVAVNVHFIPMPMLSYFTELGYEIAHYPVAYRNYACEISLPIYPQLTDDEIDYVIETVIRVHETVKAE